jgi:hypothetical protein
MLLTLKRQLYSKGSSNNKRKPINQNPTQERTYMQFIWCLMLVLIFSTEAQAGLFDNVVSQVQQTINTTQQQAAQQQAAQQRAAQQQAAQQQAAQQQAAQQQAIQQQAIQQEVPPQTTTSTPVEQAPAVDPQLEAFWVQKQPELDQQLAQGRILKVKDFYLGMRMRDAMKLISDKLGMTLEVTTGKGYQDALAGMNMFTAILGDCVAYNKDNIMQVIFVADKNRQVTTIIFTSDLVDKLFNTAGIQADAFAQKFADAYKIPNMDVFNEGSNNGWQYISKDGFKVQILDNKVIMIKKIAAENEMKFD